MISYRRVQRGVRVAFEGSPYSDGPMTLRDHGGNIMRGTLIAAGGAAFAAAALAATLAGPATADAKAHHRFHSCGMQMQEVRTWQHVHNGNVSAGTREADACRGNGQNYDPDLDSWVLRYALADDWRLNN
jgi:hypothetical protein